MIRQDQSNEVATLQVFYTQVQLAGYRARNCDLPTVAFQKFASPPLQRILSTLEKSYDTWISNGRSFCYIRKNGTLYCEEKEKQGTDSYETFYARTDFDSDFQLHVTAAEEKNHEINIGIFITRYNIPIYQTTIPYEQGDKLTTGMRVYQISKRLRQNLEEITKDGRIDDDEIKRFMDNQDIVTTILGLNRDFLLKLNRFKPST